jgi:DNA-binding CsgD family transcriptional regulator
LVERGELGRARALLGTQPEQPPGSEADSLLRRATVRLLLGERRWPEALLAAEAYGGSLRPRVVNPCWAPWRSLEAVALVGLGRPGEALALLEDELVWARRWGAPGALGRVLRLLGTTGPAPRVDVLSEAVASTEGSPARLEHAKSLVALGSALRLERKPAAAREPLRQGLELATRCGATPLARRARAELQAAGGRPRRHMLTGPGSLTPSERRVAELAAKGASNREIAQELFVTPRTVEFHLTGVYRKLGVSTRTGLSEALAGRGAT